MTDIENVQETIAPQDDGGVAVQESEEMLPKSLVTKIVERERQKAIEKIERKYMEQNQGMQPQQQAPVVESQQVGLGGMPQLSKADIERLISDHAPQALMQHVDKLRAEHTVQSFVNKMQAAEHKHPGLQEKLNDLDFDGIAPLVEMANSMDNTADVMKELVENPMKMGNLMALVYAQPKLARKAMMDLSNSIKTNQEAVAEDVQARDPMSQLKPSAKAGIDNSNMSVGDMRKMLRGR